MKPARRSQTFILLFLVFALAWGMGCSHKPKPAMTPPVTTTETTPPAPPAQPPETEATPPAATVELTDVFFDYDKYSLRDDTRSTLSDDGKALSGPISGNVLLEGHCDERGTVEYNLALGQKRADAVKSFLVEYGVPANRLSTISYGEERPFAQGHDESAWAQNRRVHFVQR